MRTLRSGVGVAALLVAVMLSGCSGDLSSKENTAEPTPSDGASATASASPDPSATPSPTPSPTPTATAVAIPDDCRAILSDDVLAQLDGVPLNDPAVGPTGIQPDGSLLCVWRHPGADTTALVTKILYMDRGPALDMLNDLANAQGFTCFTPDEGTRCEKTWQNTTYPVIDGRTLFWRDGVLIDTTYSNMAPSGYTSSIVAHLFG